MFAALALAKCVERASAFYFPIVKRCCNIFFTMAMAASSEGNKEWELEHDPFSDPEEKRVLFAALDSFR